MNSPACDDPARDRSERPAEAAARAAGGRGSLPAERVPLCPAASRHALGGDALDEALSIALDRISREWAIEL